jgi:hypothetical protein
MACALEYVQYHWTQHKVIMVAPVPRMVVCCQWMVCDRTSLELLMWGAWNENVKGRMAPDLEGVQYRQRMVQYWTQHEVIRVVPVPVPGMAVCCQWMV